MHSNSSIDVSEHKMLIRSIAKETDLSPMTVERVLEALILNGWREPANHRSIQFENRRSPVYPHGGAAVRNHFDCLGEK